MRRSKKAMVRVPATIYFQHAKNEKGNRQVCVYAVCDLERTVVGPIWGHTDRAVKKAVSELTRQCDCPAKFHNPQTYEGHRAKKRT